MASSRISSIAILTGMVALAGVFDDAVAQDTADACRAGLASHAVFPEFSGRNGARTVADLRSQLGSNAGRRAWGLDENVTIDLDRVRHVPILTVRLPKGSINPKNKSAPLGGMGWRWRAMGDGQSTRACLKYRVRFASDFGFRRGGKLPGLFGGNAPAGGKRTDGSQGFSMRLMWRRAGTGEVYAYIPGHPKGRGRSIQRGAWWFSAGGWIDIAQEVVLNDPRARNGMLRVWIDGALRLEVDDLLIRTRDDVGISGVMGDVFYGGKDASWAAPQDTWVQFSAFELFW